ncbi:MAG: hypothetical protein ACRDTJ_10500, partial [Pseudonocardiaceae bacterium]
MARSRGTLENQIDPETDDDAGTTAPPAVSESAAAPSAKKSTRSPRKKSAAPVKKAARKPAAKKPATPAEAEPLRVKGVDTADAKRASLYLHPDDYRALQLAKLDDGADLNSRMRA